MDALDNIGFFEIAEIFNNSINGAVNALAPEVFFDGAGREDTRIRAQDIIRDTAEKVGVFDFVPDDEVVFDNRAVEVLKVTKLVVRREFKALREAAPN